MQGTRSGRKEDRIFGLWASGQLRSQSDKSTHKEHHRRPRASPLPFSDCFFVVIVTDLIMPWQHVPSMLIIAGMINVTAGLIWTLDYVTIGVRRLSAPERVAK